MSLSLIPSWFLKNAGTLSSAWASLLDSKEEILDLSLGLKLNSSLILRSFLECLMTCIINKNTILGNDGSDTYNSTVRYFCVNGSQFDTDEDGYGDTLFLENRCY